MSLGSNCVVEQTAASSCTPSDEHLRVVVVLGPVTLGVVLKSMGSATVGKGASV